MTKINEYYNFQICKPGPMTNDSSVLNLASSPHRFCRCPCWCSRKRPFASCFSQVAQCWGKSRCKKMCVCWVQWSENSWLLIHVNYFPVRCDQWNYGIFIEMLMRYDTESMFHLSYILISISTRSDTVLFIAILPFMCILVSHLCQKDVCGAVIINF